MRGKGGQVPGFSFQAALKWIKRNRKIVLLTFLGIVCAAAAATIFPHRPIFLHEAKRGQLHEPGRGAPPGSGPRERHVIKMDSFVIPFDKNPGFTYMILSIAIELPNMRIKREFQHSLSRMREHVYECVRQGMKRVGGPPPVEAIKEEISGAINQALPEGRVNAIFILDYCAL
jgi:flagellar basal body-associated protein FliL